MMTPCRTGLLLVAAAALLTASCEKGKLKIYAVRGQVLYNGQPLKGVALAFHPVDAANDIGYPAHAKTDDQGNFKLTSYVDDDGAPAGEYNVALAFEVEAIDEGSDQSKKLTFQLPVKYHRKETTDIGATVAKGDNQLEPFKLLGPPLPAKR